MEVATIAKIALVAQGVSTYMQHESAKDSKEASNRQARAMEEQAAQERKRADIQQARSLRTAVRQARIARSAIINTAANAGTLNSSGAIGGAGSVMSQHNSNISYFNDVRDINDATFSAQMEQAGAARDMGNASSDGAAWGALGSLGSTVFSSAGGFKTIFDAQKKS